MQAIIISLIVLFCFCTIWLILTDNGQGSRHDQEICEKPSELQQDTFCCMHCVTRKPRSQLSTTINRMCLECAEMYEAVQDEP